MPPVLISLKQNTPEWLQWRSMGLGASDAPVIVGLSPWKSRIQLLRQKRLAWHHGVLPPNTRPNPHMLRGLTLEPKARSLYESWSHTSAPPACFQHPEFPWMRASCDGWIESSRTLLEIKCPGIADHRQALQGLVPPKYIPQLHHAACVTHASSVHYLSYNETFPPGDRLVVLVFPIASKAIYSLLKAEREFWLEVIQPEGVNDETNFHGVVDDRER